MTEERQFVEYERKGNIVTIAMNMSPSCVAAAGHFAAAPMYISASYAPVRSSSGSAVRKVTARTPAIC